jgi:hypothetical protein
VSGTRTVELPAQWALWGADAEDSTYRVLASGGGDLTRRDFEDIVGRYAAGTPDRLPQYTAFWVPDPAGNPWFVGIAIHEHASYAPHDERSHYDTSGREINYSRLFCVPYAELAGHRVTLTELLTAIEQQPSPGHHSDSVTLRVTPGNSRPSPVPRPDDAPPDLAEVVAALLLTGRRVCVVGADELPATDRLAFVDQAMSLLPYGLRATMSAATWASPTARDLKLRMFFASTPRDDGAVTHHVRWGQRGWGTQAPPDGEVARQYLEWLHAAGARAADLLAEQTVPTRFSAAELRATVLALPKDLRVSKVLRDLADMLREGDVTAAMKELRELGRGTSGSVPPADREHYRAQVLRYGLLGNHQGLRPSDKEHLYRRLLPLAFEFPLSYGDYCAIEDAIGGPPHRSLRSVLVELGFASYIPWLLAVKAESRSNDKELMGTLHTAHVPAADPLDEFDRDLASIRPQHRAAICDFALLYLRVHAVDYGLDAKAELARRGYLADTLAAAFPDNAGAQQDRLADALRYVHGDELGRSQVRALFAEPDIRPTPAFEAAVAQVAARSVPELLIARQAADARARRADHDGRAARHPETGRDQRHQPLQMLLRRLAGRSDDQ